MATTTRLTDPYNDKESYVAKDLIWRDHIAKIDLAQKCHGEKWGFLNDLQPQIAAYDPKRSPRALLARAAPPDRRSESKTIIEQAQQRITVCPSPRPVPTTTSSLIGWRTADKNCSLEKYGKYARGQESLHRKFKWPVEGFD